MTQPLNEQELRVVAFAISPLKRGSITKLWREVM